MSTTDPLSPRALPGPGLRQWLREAFTGRPTPQPCRWTRPHWRMSGQRAAKVSALMRRDCQTSFLVVCGQ